VEEAYGRNRLADVPRELDPKQIKAIRRLHLKDKWPMRRIARHMGISRKTIRKHLSPSRPPCPSPQRASKLDSYKPAVAELLQRDFTVKSVAILRHLRSLGYQGGQTILRDYVRKIRTKSSGPSITGSRQEVFDWMRAVLQGALGRSELASELSHVAELDKLLAAIIEGRLSNRNKAMAVLARERGIGQSYVCSFLYLAKKTATKYWSDYKRGGSAALFARKPSARQKSNDDRIKEAVFALLHSPPSMHGINRSTWRLTDLQAVLRSQGQPLCHDVIRAIIKGAGYKWRKARIVLTSNDPEYKAKVDAIQEILSRLRAEEAFFSIDEYGPFAVKKKGGRKRVAPGDQYTVPQWQKSKGYLIITGALELSQNQVTHFYSKKKNTEEMIKMMDLLRTQYRHCSTIYLSWDAASWHISKQLFAEIEKRNAEAEVRQYPIVKTAPLPAGAQFLNVIESIFSGMSRAIIPNSDYPSIEAAKQAIDTHFSNRNKSFRQHPRRAGGKIWGSERVSNEFRESNNCKDPLYR
jgi:transposase